MDDQKEKKVMKDTTNNKLYPKNCDHNIDNDENGTKELILASDLGYIYYLDSSYSLVKVGLLNVTYIWNLEFVNVNEDPEDEIVVNANGDIFVFSLDFKFLYSLDGSFDYYGFW